MAIYQIKRNTIYQIMKTIEIKTMPLEYVDQIICRLDNGDIKIISMTNIDQTGNGFSDLEEFIKTFDWYESLNDMDIKMNYVKLEEEVISAVNNLLKHEPS